MRNFTIFINIYIFKLIGINYNCFCYNSGRTIYNSHSPNFGRGFWSLFNIRLLISFIFVIFMRRCRTYPFMLAIYRRLVKSYFDNIVFIIGILVDSKTLETEFEYCAHIVYFINVIFKSQFMKISSTNNFCLCYFNILIY